LSWIQAAERELDGLDHQIARRILKFLFERVSRLADPRSVGQAMHGSKFGEFWKYRVGDWRAVCKIEDEQETILVLPIRPRGKAYRQRRSGASCTGLISGGFLQ